MTKHVIGIHDVYGCVLLYSSLGRMKNVWWYHHNTAQVVTQITVWMLTRVFAGFLSTHFLSLIPL